MKIRRQILAFGEKILYICTQKEYATTPKRRLTMQLKKLLLSLILSTTVITATHAQQLAFPEAQGWGRFALGARASSAPTVYHVTNLNDSGTGSLRDAVSQSNRIVVFDVSGVINISSRISFASNLYVAGQTAPGEGITIYGDGVTFSGASNLICRYLRVRMGHGGSDGKDCAGIARGTNMIFDHCSFSWGLDETFSINPDGKGDIGDITIQNCIVGQGLMTHSAGGLMQADNVTLYRNLYCDNSTRNNKVKGKNQYANNIVYNWKNGAYLMGGSDSNVNSYANIESNLFINGPSGGGNAFTEASAKFNCYASDNWQDSNCDGKFNPFEVTNYSSANRVSTPYDYPKLPLYKGNELMEKLLPTVGASLPYRDQADYYMIDEVNSLGTSGALITYETALPIGAPSTWTWWKGEKVYDTDNDGMPDWWETENGTNPNANDATKKADNGYLNIENYINSITEKERQFFLRQPITPWLKASTTSTMTVAWRDYTYGEDGFCIEIEKDGTWEEVGRTTANATSYTATALNAGTSYKTRVRAFATHQGEEVYSAYTPVVEMLTRPAEVGVIDIDNYKADNTLGKTQKEINTTTTDWLEGIAFKTGNHILLAHDDEATVSITEAIEPAAVVVSGKGNLTLTGTGSINGETTSLNKAGTGALSLEGKHGYKGATVNHEGIVHFKYIANGGAVSSIGASQSFAQNWIFDGGTYNYTGASASSNRAARIDRPSTLSIANASTTLTLNGTFEGNSQLTLDGKGTLSIANANFFGYKGATRLKGGKLYLSDTENACKTFGESGKKVIMAGGCLQFASKNEDYQNLNFPIEVEDGTTSILSMPTHCYMKSVITGNGTLQFDIPYVRAYLRPDLSNFTGTLVGNANKGSGLFYNETQWNAPKTRFEIKNGITLSSWASNATNILGGLSGEAGSYLAGTSKQSKGFTCLWEVGSAHSDETFHGIINNLPAGGNAAYSGTTSIKKVGTGLWRLTGNNVYSGTTTVNGGTLIVNGNHTGTGAVSVAKDATLKGTGTLAGKVTAANGATIMAGDEEVNQSMLKLTGGLTLQKGSRLVIPIKKKENGGVMSNLIRVTGAMSITTGAVLEIDLSQATGHEFKAGDVICVFNNTSLMTSKTGMFTTFSPETPGEGLHWDTTTLLSDGNLRVVRDGEVYEGGDTPAEETKKAKLEHTASVQGGSNAAAKYLDQAEHYYNNWGTTAWVAQAYAEFSFDISEGAEVQEATYSVSVNCARGTRTFDVCYLPAGTPRITSTSTIPELCAKKGTQVATYSDISTNYTTKTINVTQAIREMAEAGQNYIIFVMSNGAAGGNIHGKGHANAPTLTITTYKDPSTDIEEVKNEEPGLSNCLYDLSGRKVNGNTTKKGIYIKGGKKVVVHES